VSFDPIFVFDSREKWHPVGVEESLKPSSYYWQGTSRQFAKGDPSRLNAGVDCLDFPADMKQSDLPPVGYHRATAGGPLVWHQYWLWSLYNPWSVAGVGRHEGDWEFVQIGVTPITDSPVLVTASQHHSGGKREFWACELRDGRPVIYVALGSHANYFHAGRLGGGQDECDGKGRVLDSIEWRDFGPWKDWPGRWGNSSGQGKSPESPGCQGKRWHAPHLFHSEARG
jgi:hypothetical protein